MCLIPRRPWVPMTMRSQSRSEAVSTMASAAETLRIRWVSTVMSGFPGPVPGEGLLGRLVRRRHQCVRSRAGAPPP